MLVVFVLLINRVLWRTKATQFVHTYGFKDQSSLQQLFQDLLQQGHQIAVATHSTFPHAIMERLKILGITAEQMNATPIICGGFCDVGFGKKKIHISFNKTDNSSVTVLRICFD